MSSKPPGATHQSNMPNCDADGAIFPDQRDRDSGVQFAIPLGNFDDAGM